MTDEVRCEVCGEPATRYIGNGTLPVCDNDVCYHTRIEEVNAELRGLTNEVKEVEV